MLFESLLPWRWKESYRSWFSRGPRSNIEECLWGYLVVIFGILDILDVEDLIVLNLSEQLLVESGHLSEVEREFTWVIERYLRKALVLKTHDGVQFLLLSTVFLFDTF